MLFSISKTISRKKEHIYFILSLQAFLLAVIKANKAKVCELNKWQFAGVLKHELFAIPELTKSQTKQKRLFTRND